MKDEEYIMMLLKEISCDVSTKLNKLYEPYGLTCIQFDILVQLSFQDHVTITMLAKKMHMMISNLSAILQRMEKHGFIERYRDEKDQRNVYIKLSQQSLNMLEEMNCCACKKEEVFQGITQEDILVIRKGLEKLHQVLKECDV